MKSNLSTVEKKNERKVTSPLIKIDTSSLDKFPKWAKSYVQPTFARPWPRQFCLHEIDLWFSAHQKSVEVLGYEVYEELKRSEMFRKCLNLYHGMAIKRKGVPFFCKFFEGKNLFLWGSASIDADDCGIDVPYLFIDKEKNKVGVDWRCLDLSWTFKDPGIIFKKEM